MIPATPRTARRIATALLAATFAFTAAACNDDDDQIEDEIEQEEDELEQEEEDLEQDLEQEEEDLEQELEEDLQD